MMVARRKYLGDRIHRGSSAVRTGGSLQQGAPWKAEASTAITLTTMALAAQPLPLIDEANLNAPFLLSGKPTPRYITAIFNNN